MRRRGRLLQDAVCLSLCDRHVWTVDVCVLPCFQREIHFILQKHSTRTKRVSNLCFAKKTMIGVRMLVYKEICIVGKKMCPQRERTSYKMFPFISLNHLKMLMIYLYLYMCISIYLYICQFENLHRLPRFSVCSLGEPPP